MTLVPWLRWKMTSGSEAKDFLQFIKNDAQLKAFGQCVQQVDLLTLDPNARAFNQRPNRTALVVVSSLFCLMIKCCQLPFLVLTNFIWSCYWIRLPLLFCAGWRVLSGSILWRVLSWLELWRTMAKYDELFVSLIWHLPSSKCSYGHFL